MSDDADSTKADLQTPFDADGALKKKYDSLYGIYQALIDEVAFILDDASNEHDIKVDKIEKRVKEWDSIVKKCVDKHYKNPFLDLNDIAGTRVICLLRSDLEKIGSIIGSLFEVISCDDKILQSTDSFGYMSVHYICKIKGEHTGPRYKKIKGINFEIQVRTLSMHAWAAISRHLEYRGDWDVPAHLKKSLNALSGLFYVADSEFEEFFLEREKVRSNASKDMARQKSTDEEINFDTVSAYLLAKFPTRQHSEKNFISSLVKEIKDAGYTNISIVQRDVERALDAFQKYEKQHPPSSGTYADIGVVRICLSIVSDEYIKVRDPPVSSIFYKQYQAYRDLVKPLKN